MTPILQVQSLSHTYSKDTPFWRDALTDISFSVSKGEFLAILGHTGSGKSTLLRHLNGLLKPTSGRILFDGRDLWENPRYTREARFRIGLVFQYPEYQLFDETVSEDIAFGPKNMGCSKEEIRQRVAEAAEIVNLSEEELQSSPFALSGGQKRRAAIAGILAMRPEVLILDEPTAGLDPEGSRQILQHILQYRSRTNAAVIMVSHSMEDAARYADRILVLNEGRCVMDGTTKEVFSEADKLVEIGLDIPQVTRVLLKLRELGVPVDPSAYTAEDAVNAILQAKEAVR